MEPNEPEVLPSVRDRLDASLVENAQLREKLKDEYGRLEHWRSNAINSWVEIRDLESRLHEEEQNTNYWRQRTLEAWRERDELRGYLYGQGA